jgi:hypothetical protein
LAGAPAVAYGNLGNVCARSTADLTATPLPRGQVLIAGGRDRCNAPVSSAELFDVSAGGFIGTGSMTAARAAPTATLLDTWDMLVAGGDDNNLSLASAELYEPLPGPTSP